MGTWVEPDPWRPRWPERRCPPPPTWPERHGRCSALSSGERRPPGWSLGAAHALKCSVQALLWAAFDGGRAAGQAWSMGGPSRRGQAHERRDQGYRDGTVVAGHGALSHLDPDVVFEGSFACATRLAVTAAMPGAEKGRPLHRQRNEDGQSPSWLA